MKDVHRYALGWAVVPAWWSHYPEEHGTSNLDLLEVGKKRGVDG